MILLQALASDLAHDVEHSTGGFGSVRPWLLGRRAIKFAQ
jgi:hypothetical protein